MADLVDSVFPVRVYSRCAPVSARGSETPHSLLVAQEVAPLSHDIKEAQNQWATLWLLPEPSKKLESRRVPWEKASHQQTKMVNKAELGTWPLHSLQENFSEIGAGVLKNRHPQ